MIPFDSTSAKDKLVNIRTVDKMRGSRIPQRWVLVVMGCLGLASSVMMKTCLSVAITEMVKPTEKMVSNDSFSHDACPGFELRNTSATAKSGGTYDWDEHTQGIILSSFYWGFVITQIPGGILAVKFGGKYILGFSILSSAVLTLLTPKVIQLYGSTGLIVLQSFMGFGEGIKTASISELISHWAPAHERSRMFTLFVSGVNLGSVTGISLSGVLITNSSIGWPIVFYVFGASGVVWFVAWVFLCYSYPDDHPFISDEEKKYLQQMMKKDIHKQKQPTPWRHILTSVPVWAMMVENFGACWGYYILISDLPKYVSNVLRLPVQANGFLSALPHLLPCFVGNASSWLADWLIKENKISRTHVRRNACMLASVLTGTCLIAASYAGCDYTLIMIFFVIGGGMQGLFLPSVGVNPNDLSPNYSGTLAAMYTFTGSLAGMAAPYVAGLLTPNQTLMEWRMVFWINFSIMCACALVFYIWADGEVQKWNDPDPRVVEIEFKDEVPFSYSPVNTETERTDSIESGNK